MTQYRLDALQKIKTLSDATKADINSITRFVVQTMKVSSAEYGLIDAQILEHPGINKTVYGFKPFKNIFEYSAFSDWSDSPTQVLDICAKMKAPLGAVVLYFKLNEWSWTKDLVQQLEQSSYFNKLIDLDWMELIRINDDYDSLVSYADRCYSQLTFSDQAVSFDNEKYRILIKYLEDVDSDTHEEMRSTILNHKKHKSSLRYMLAVYTWENLNQNGLRGVYASQVGTRDYTSDVHIFNTLYEEKIDGLLLREILEKTFKSNPQILEHPDLHKEFLNSTKQNLWAAPYWSKQVLKNPSMSNDFAVATLNANILHNDSEYSSEDLYSATSTHAALIHVYKASPRYVISNMLSWISEVKKIDDIPDTPLTRHVLMLALRSFESKDNYFKSEVSKRYPGFNTERGREKLIAKILPGLNVPVAQPDLFSTEYLLTILGSDIAGLNITAVELPALN